MKKMAGGKKRNITLRSATLVISTSAAKESTTYPMPPQYHTSQPPSMVTNQSFTEIRNPTLTEDHTTTLVYRYSPAREVNFPLSPILPL
jgi:hypothetical protein